MRLPDKDLGMAADNQSFGLSLSIVIGAYAYCDNNAVGFRREQITFPA
jgi:hypothetical protein